jgi:hypothetical protein
MSFCCGLHHLPDRRAKDVPRFAFAKPWIGSGSNFGRSVPICSIAEQGRGRQRDQPRGSGFRGADGPDARAKPAAGNHGYLSVTEETTVADIAILLETNRIKRMPVLRGAAYALGW